MYTNLKLIVKCCLRKTFKNLFFRYEPNGSDMAYYTISIEKMYISFNVQSVTCSRKIIKLNSNN